MKVIELEKDNYIILVKKDENIFFGKKAGEYTNLAYAELEILANKIGFVNLNKKEVTEFINNYIENKL